jgi:hypothetical protein
VKSIKVSKIGLSRNGGVLPKEKSNFSLDFFLVLLWSSHFQIVNPKVMVSYINLEF